MIHKEYSAFVAECDTCGTEETFYTDDWDTLIAEMKQNGWRNVKTPQGWENSCPECSKPGAAFL